jgi:SAM-dependent methyltransferase
MGPATPDRVKSPFSPGCPATFQARRRRHQEPNVSAYTTNLGSGPRCDDNLRSLIDWDSPLPILPRMASDLTFTGERFLPGCAGEIAYEHWHRYAFARRFAAGRRVLDAACGEGYGTSLLGAVASSAMGVDIDAATIAHASARYGNGTRIRFVEGSCAKLPLPDASFDVIVSFETIEHLAAADQPPMLAEFARVLAPGGIVVISSPNKRVYSDERGYANEFHLHELYRDDFARMLAPVFPAQRWHHQRVACWSGIWAESPGTDTEAWLGDARGIAPYQTTEGMYFVVVAARSPEALPLSMPHVSLFTDADDSEGKRAEANAREVLRLDALLKQTNAEVERQAGRIQQQERLLDEHARSIADKDRLLGDAERRLADGAQAIAALEREIARLHDAVTAQERIVSYRQSFRWWLQLPWVRLKLRLAKHSRTT